MPVEPRADDIRALAAEHPAWFSAASPDAPLAVSELGRGESYLAWLVRRGTGESAEEIVVRIPHKAASEIPLPPREELALLERVPEGLGARPIAALDVRDADGRPERVGASSSDAGATAAGAPVTAIVTSRVAGRQLPAREWEGRQDLLDALARQLARLHHGGATEGLASPARIDPLADAEAAMEWWREHEPASAAAGERIWAVVRAHQTAAREAFAHIDVRFLHGDAAAANILVDDAGVPRFVDWEWAQMGDVARDLAFIGGDLHLEPWYAHLDPREARAQTEAYVAQREALAPGSAQLPALDVDGLLQRRAAFLVHETFFTGLHLHRVGERGDADAAQRHLSIMQQLGQSLV